MNQWSEIKPVVIFESDDFQNSWSRNGLNFLYYWKAKYPNFKVTLFTIPDKTTNEFLSMLPEWMEIAVHGFTHESNFECFGWDYDKTKVLMERTLKDPTYVRMFKSPGWTITPGGPNDLGGCGYAAAPEDPINKDPQAVYKALGDLQFTIVDRHYNKAARPDGVPIICIDCNDLIVHSHTWPMMTPNENERNGFEQVEMRGVPWDNNTEFFTMGEAWAKGLILPCQP